MGFSVKYTIQLLAIPPSQETLYISLLGLKPPSHQLKKFIRLYPHSYCRPIDVPLNSIETSNVWNINMGFHGTYPLVMTHIAFFLGKNIEIVSLPMNKM